MQDHYAIVEDALTDALVACSQTEGTFEIFPGDPGEKVAPKGSAWVLDLKSEFDVVELGGGDGNQDETIVATVLFYCERSGSPSVRAAREARRAVGAFRAAFVTWANENFDDLGSGSGAVISATLGEADRKTWAAGDAWCCEATQQVVVECRSL